VDSIADAPDAPHSFSTQFIRCLIHSLMCVRFRCHTRLNIAPLIALLVVDWSCACAPLCPFRQRHKDQTKRKLALKRRHPPRLTLYLTAQRSN
jgi:hypothetical protein